MWWMHVVCCVLCVVCDGVGVGFGLDGEARALATLWRRSRLRTLRDGKEGRVSWWVFFLVLLWGGGGGGFVGERRGDGRGKGKGKRERGKGKGKKHTTLGVGLGRLGFRGGGVGHGRRDECGC